MSATASRKNATRSTTPTSPSPVQPIRFDSIDDMATATNDEHIKVLLDELPWMRAGIFILNMNDRELEAKIYTAGSENAHDWFDVVEALT